MISIYQALYRKWRPQTFDDVVGQPHITETLKQQVRTDRLSHAYLFIGTRGTGKTTCAKILAKAVNCEHPVNGNPCNCCAACRGIDDGSVLDVVELDAASNNGVDNVRALRDEAVFSPANVKKRVYIVDEVHMLSMSAFNALLKILEEPPAHLMFILATTELHKVPATILSRCQRHSFKRIAPDEIAARLNYVAAQEKLDLQPDAAQLLARLANGGMRDALTLLDQCSGAEHITQDAVLSAMGLAGTLRTAALLEAAAAGSAAEALTQFRALWQDGKDPAALLDELAGLMRDALMRAVAPKGGDALLSGAYDAATLDRFVSLLGTGRLLSDLTVVQDALAGMATATDTRLAAELCIIRLSRPQLQDDLSGLAARVTALENGAAPTRVIVQEPAAKPAPAPAEAIPQSPAADPMSAPESVPEPEPQPEPAPEPQPAPPEDVPFDLDRPPLPEEPPFDLDRPPFPEEPPMRPDPIPEPPAQFDPIPEPPAQFDPIPEPPAPKPEPPAPKSAPAAPAAVGGDSTLWERVCAAMRGKLQIADYMLLQDPLQVSPSLEGDTLHIRLDKSFAAMQFNKPAIADLLREAAAECAGRPIRVEMSEMDAREQINRRSIDELARFGNVTIK